MAKSAEKLIILADVCRGLLARVYNLTPDHFQRPSTLGLDVEKVTKMLVKRFPDHPADLDKIQMELFNKRAQEMVTELQDYYLTFLDVMDFSEAALKVLLDMSKSIVGFKFDVNADLMQFYLDLFVSYIQLHLLVARAVDSKLMLSAYAKAYHSTHGNTEPGYLKIVTYIQNFANPLERLRDELKDVSLIIGDTLITLFPIVMKWSEPQSLQMNKVFAIVEDVKEMDKDTGFDKHIELLSLDKFHLWVLYGYLVCPGGLQRDNALTLLQFCLRDVFCVPVYRDLSMNIHEELSKIFDSFVGANKFKLSKQKKFLKDAREDAVATLDRHRLCRTILRVELQTMLGVFNEFQQLLAPKFHMVLCGLRLARNELLWYFRHIGVPPHKAKKVSKEGEFADPQLSELLFLIDRLITLVLRNKRTIQEFYLNKLNTVDGPQLHSIVDTFNRQARISHGVSEVLSEVLTALSAADNDFEAMRLNWYRVSVQLNTQPQPASTQIAQPLNQAMLTVVQHSRAIDRLDGLVKLHGSLSGLYWWRTQLTQLLKDSIASSGGQAAHWMAFVVAVNHALDNVHRNCPEEQKLIGSNAVKLTESFLGAIVQQLTSLIFAIAGKLSKLRAQIAPVEVVYRLQRASLNKGQTDPLPGYESLYQCRAVIKDLRAYEKIVADICNAVRNVDTITIFNMEFVPREYIYEGVSNTVRDAIRKISLAEKQIQRPTVILSQLRDIVYAFVHLDRHLTVNLSDIVRDVLVSEFTDPSAGGVGEAVLEEVEEKKEGGQVLINTIAAWYVKEIQTFQERGVTYSPTTKSFVTLNQTSVPVEYHFDYAELRALCTLIGPGGVRVIQRLLLTLISQHVGVIKEILRKNDDALKALSGRFTEKTLWLEQMGRLVDLDKLVRHSILVGTALKFRKLVQSALEEVTRQRVPFLHDSVRTVFLQYPSNVTMDAKLAPVDFLAQDLGLELETADHSLKIALRKHKNVSSDEPLLSHLPELFACSLIAPSWRESQYLIQTESHNNNVHLTATTLTTLVSCFHGIPVVTSDIPVDTRIRADLERFLRSSCYCLLHMSQSKPNEAFSGFPLQSLSVFIEFLVKESGCLTLSILEDFYPFTLLRTNYIQMYEKQAVNGKSYVPVADDEKE